jgi:rare lipoprotein A
MHVGRASILGLSFAVGFATVAPAGDAKSFSGEAAHYSENYKGVTASGSPYNPDKFTCAHRTLPFGTRVRVTDLRTGRSVLVVVNDRGPVSKSRVIDLSLAAAKALRMAERGLIKVTAEVEP